MRNATHAKFQIGREGEGEGDWVSRVLINYATITITI